MSPGAMVSARVMLVWVRLWRWRHIQVCPARPGGANALAFWVNHVFQFCTVLDMQITLLISLFYELHLAFFFQAS